MAASASQMKTPNKDKTAKAPKAPKTEKELRAEFGDKTTKLLKVLARTASRAERIMKKNAASEAQLEVFRKGVETYTGRITRAARGEASGEGIVVPAE